MTTEYLPFAFVTGAHVLGPAAWSGHSDRQQGFMAGVADSRSFNTVWRQSSVMTAAIAQFIDNNVSQNVPDDGDVAVLSGLFSAAVVAAAATAGTATTALTVTVNPAVRGAINVQDALTAINTAVNNISLTAAAVTVASPLTGGNVQTELQNIRTAITAGGGGTVTDITATAPLTGGTITGSGAIGLTTPLPLAHGGTGAITRQGVWDSIVAPGGTIEPITITPPAATAIDFANPNLRLTADTTNGNSVVRFDTNNANIYWAATAFHNWWGLHRVVSGTDTDVFGLTDAFAYFKLPLYAENIRIGDAYSGHAFNLQLAASPPSIALQIAAPTLGGTLFSLQGEGGLTLRTTAAGLSALTTIAAAGGYALEMQGRGLFTGTIISNVPTGGGSQWVLYQGPVLGGNERVNVGNDGGMTLSRPDSTNALTINNTGSATGLYVNNQNHNVTKGIAIRNISNNTGAYCLDIDNQTAAGVGMRLSSGTNTGIQIQRHYASGVGLTVSSANAGVAGTAMTLSSLGVGSKCLTMGSTAEDGSGIEVWRWTPTTELRWKVLIDGSQAIAYNGSGTALNINSYGTGNSLHIHNGFTDHLTIAANGTIFAYNGIDIRGVIPGTNYGLLVETEAMIAATPPGWARVRYNVAGQRQWSAGVNPTGAYQINDETSALARLYIDANNQTTSLVGNLEVGAAGIGGNLYVRGDGMNDRFDLTGATIGFGWTGTLLRVYVNGAAVGSVNITP